MTDTSPVQLVRADGLADSPCAYPAVTPATSRLVHTSGVSPLDLGGAVVAPGDAAGQTAQVMDNLVAALAAAGATLTDVVKTTVYVASSRSEDLHAV